MFLGTPQQLQSSKSLQQIEASLRTPKPLKQLSEHCFSQLWSAFFAPDAVQRLDLTRLVHTINTRQHNQEMAVEAYFAENALEITSAASQKRLKSANFLQLLSECFRSNPEVIRKLMPDCTPNILDEIVNIYTTGKGAISHEANRQLFYSKYRLRDQWKQNPNTFPSNVFLASEAAENYRARELKAKQLVKQLESAIRLLGEESRIPSIAGIALFDLVTNDIETEGVYKYIVKRPTPTYFTTYGSSFRLLIDQLSDDLFGNHISWDIDFSNPAVVHINKAQLNGPATQRINIQVSEFVADQAIKHFLRLLSSQGLDQSLQLKIISPMFFDSLTIEIDQDSDHRQLAELLTNLHMIDYELNNSNKMPILDHRGLMPDIQLLPGISVMPQPNGINKLQSLLAGQGVSEYTQYRFSYKLLAAKCFERSLSIAAASLQEQVTDPFKESSLIREAAQECFQTMFALADCLDS